MSSKKNTLYNYFTKTPTNEASGGSKSKTFKSSPKKSSPKDKQKNKIKKSPKEKVSLTFQCPYSIGDLVWAKLSGYPSWPSVVCEHPTERQFCKWDGSGNCQELHVQFIDKPPSHAWIKEKNVKVFKVDDSSVNKPSDPKWHLSVKEAKKTLELSPKDRVAVILSGKFITDENESVTLNEMENEITAESKKESNKRKESDRASSEKSLKRIRLTFESDDSEDEYKPVDDIESESISSGESEKSLCPSEVEESPPAKKKKIKPGVNGFKNSNNCSSLTAVSSPKISERTKSLLSSFSANDSFTKSNQTEASDDKGWAHLDYDFLKPEKIRDANKRLPSDQDYNPKTLYVPDSFTQKLTPGVRQWWEIKAKHFDTILFFKVGKFYELYHMDAVVGVNELNLVYMKGEMAHSGFPEIAYGRYASSLVERGYQVARVEQTETPLMMEERCKKLSRPTKFDRVVNRELCQITSKGTKKYSFLDSQGLDVNALYLLAVTEKVTEGKAGCENEYGVCFIETSLATFHIGQFRDDRHASRFRTLISQYPPVQVLYERRCLSTKSLQILNSTVNPKLIESLLSKTQFWDSSHTLRFLADGSYFKDKTSSASVVWPDTIQSFLSESDSLGLTAKTEFDLAIKALGAIIWYLKESRMEEELLSKKKFVNFVCNDFIPTTVKQSNKWDYFKSRRNMILDGVTLKNLDVLQNNGLGTLEGSLISKLDHCSTPAGKRLLHQWICSPLVQPTLINDRLDAVEDLIANNEILLKVSSILKKLPDLERLLTKIHSMGHSINNVNHPDNRAIFYEDVTYSKRKIMDFITALDGFKLATSIIELFEAFSSNLKSTILKQCVTLIGDSDSGGLFPKLNSLLKFFENSFDQEKAKKDGNIIPSPGVDKDYDEAIEEIKETSKEIDIYLEKQCKLFDCKVTYSGTGRNRFQLEVPDRAISKATNKHELQGQRKGYKRYWTSEIKNMLQTMMVAEDKRDNALKIVMSKIFLLFSKDSEKWNMAVQCLATLDVLISFALYSQNNENSMCRPEVVIPSSDKPPFLRIVNGRHPCISHVFGGGEFIPNDIAIGNSKSDDSDSSNVILITGPNMGGKSTLLRQVGLITIIAQLGSYVPADECVLTPVDRIFSRLGASDKIMMGESTFFVELSETSATLQHATEHSLILMDELGRGTSTFDGMAIAYAVVNYYSTKIACRTLFSTHYHHLVQTFLPNMKCKLFHMACLVENENVDDPTQETITFLYKLASGACPKSYGFNAAKLAGMSEGVIRVAHRKAIELEETMSNKNIFRSVFQNSFSRDQLLKLTAYECS